ncbi:MAG: hypothetical protein K6F23_10090 [Solobacterium sp.]|nr:hypothetical protein [Solobacterium sp.]
MNEYRQQLDSSQRLEKFSKLLSDSEPMVEFDPVIFDLLVETVLVGGYTNDVPDPYKITFIFKGGSQNSIDGAGFKEDRRKKKALHPVWNNEGMALHSDEEGEAPALQVLSVI